MKRLVFAAALGAVSLIATQAQAAHRHHHWGHHARNFAHHHRGHHRHFVHRHHWRTVATSGNWITVSTAAGINITVAANLASRFQALIADFVAAGYHPHHIGCAAHGGHVRNSRHYAGAACDFDQRGWGKTVGFMYTARAHEIIVAHGFRDGRAFHDQGHVDDGGVRYAHNVRHSKFGG